MRLLIGILKWTGLLVAVPALGGAGWLYVMPPELIRVGAAFAAKTVCSNVFIAKRDAREVLAEDVQAPGHPLLGYIKIDDSSPDAITASLMGVFAAQTAVYREGLGCAVAASGDPDRLRGVVLKDTPSLAAKSDFEWPLGDVVSLPTHRGVEALISDDALAGPGVRAIVVVHDGRIIAERYGTGFDAATPLNGWSMTKTVTGAIVAARVADGELGWEQDYLLPQWSDDRASIKLSDLMSMQSGLDIEERYGDVNDVTRMLFLEPDQAAFISRKPLAGPPASRFSYTTGSVVLLSKIWMDTFADRAEALAYPRRALFDPIGMRSAVLETDEAGTFSGGSLMYATARDWARFGQLLLDRGDWNGVRVLAEAFADMVASPTELSGQTYTKGLAWKKLHGDDAPEPAVPADTYWARGHDGQSLAVVPSARLVVVRMGLTPDSAGYRPERLLGRIVKEIADVAADRDATDSDEQNRVGDEAGE